jgi:cytochrome c oxidase cbb3-type subunit 4
VIEAMETYTAMRHFADSWGLVAFMLFFIGVILFVFRPGSRQRYDDNARIPLRNDNED